MEDDKEELVQIQNDNSNILQLEGRHRQVRELEDDIVTINEYNLIFCIKILIIPDILQI